MQMAIKIPSHLLLHYGIWPRFSTGAQGHRHVALLLTPGFCNRNGSLDLSELLWLGCRRPNASSTKTPRSLMTPVCIEAVFCSLILSAIYALSYAHGLLALNSLHQLANRIVAWLNPIKSHYVPLYFSR